MQFNEWVQNRAIREIAVSLAAEEVGEIFLERTEVDALQKILHAAEFLGDGDESDDAAKKYIAKEIYPIIYKTAQGFMGRHDSLVDDVAQETFMYIIKKLEENPNRIRDMSSVKNWLRGITKKISMKMRAKSGQELVPPPMYVSRDEEGRVQKTKRVGGFPQRQMQNYFVQSKRFNDPADEMSTEQERETIRAGLEELGRREPVKARMLRKIFFDDEGRTQTQMAGELGVSKVEFGKQKNQAFDFLRKLMLQRGVNFGDRGFRKQGRGIAGGGRESRRTAQYADVKARGLGAGSGL